MTQNSLTPTSSAVVGFVGLGQQGGPMAGGFDAYGRHASRYGTCLPEPGRKGSNCLMVDRERPVAEFAPSFRNIKLYADGRISYQGKSGSVIGAVARVEKSGEKHGLRDTRKVVLRIDGPDVAISASLPAAAFKVHKQAEEFVAQVNQVSNPADGSNPALGVESAPDPPETIHQSTLSDRCVPGAASDYSSTLQSMDALMGRLERLGKLRDSGVLTEDEFQVQKNTLLRATQRS